MFLRSRPSHYLYGLTNSLNLEATNTYHYDISTSWEAAHVLINVC